MKPIVSSRPSSLSSSSSLLSFSLALNSSRGLSRTYASICFMRVFCCARKMLPVPGSKLAHFRQVTIDPGTGNIFLAQQNTRMKQMEAYVLDKPREGFKAKEKDDDEDD